MPRREEVGREGRRGGGRAEERREDFYRGLYRREDLGMGEFTRGYQGMGGDGEEYYGGRFRSRSPRDLRERLG